MSDNCAGLFLSAFVRSAARRLRAAPVRQAWICLLLGALAFGAMYPVLRADFVYWDETGYIINNPYIREFSWRNLAAIFSKTDLALYTPLSTFSFTFDYALGRLDPGVYHAGNLLLHILNTMLVFFLGGRLGLPGFGAFFMAALFGVHPMHVESVAWVAERKDVLYSFFYLSSLLAYLRFRGSGNAKEYLAAFGLFGLAMLAKPMAVTLPVILMLCDWYSGGQTAVRAGLKNKIPFLAVSILSALSLVAPKLLSASGNTAEIASGLSRTLMAPFFSWMFYIVRLLVPVNLCGMYAVDGNSNWVVFYVVLAEVVIMLGVVPLAVRRKTAPLFGLLFYTITLFPVSQVVKFGPVLVADRYTYLPALGLFFIASHLLCGVLERLSGRMRAAALACALAVLVAFGLAANLRARVWKDSLVFWQDALSKNDISKSVKVNLSNAYIRLGQHGRAKPLLASVLESDPDRATALINYGICVLKAGDIDGSLAVFERARNARPESGDVYANLASAYFAKGDYSAAVANMKEAIRLNPGRNSYNYNMAYYKAKALKEGACPDGTCRADAERYLLEFLKYEPDNKDGRKFLCLHVLTPARARKNPFCRPGEAR
ncbi:MAG: tetratricopeptide repeat protein [Elusimicrobiaceae bacterium]|nr:tetratricopeptide repeat protein [Elusimicrobiaceae bacterium]